ncbi:MBL fold metallo-hydrolase [Paenibacillus sp. P46E]|uniref:MBL fold metallo-hydrolase n=1 Tax=Paenibacillus sp. P46E TaxID=1349436 RepID=UPI00273DD396|nr:MBL fold metallo-hydrolase [Paenibacillus sp. P46E]
MRKTELISGNGGDDSVRKIDPTPGEGGSDSMQKVGMTSWEGGIIQVSVPMDLPLRQVNSYILPDRNRQFTVIDPGPHTPQAELAWENVLKELGYSWGEIRDIVITHHHPDHYGLAGWLQSRSGGKVWISERAHAEARLTWGEAATLNEALPQFFLSHGMPGEWIQGVREHLERFLPQVTPQPDVTYLNTTEPFLMGNRKWKPIVTGGHAPGHLSFYDGGSGQILCGDAVLPQISPNVSLQPGSDPQPLLTFMEGLRELRSLRVSQAFPGHRKPFAGFTERADSLLRHHEERLDTTAALLEDGPLSGFAVCEALFRSRVSNAHQMRFAMSEALAHLAELVRRERAAVIRPEHGGVTTFAAVK